MANSARLGSLIRDGKLYLSLRDAIDLALEDNLDIVIARYNLPIAQMDILRTKAGGFSRGVNTGVVTGTPGGAGVVRWQRFGGRWYKQRRRRCWCGWFGPGAVYLGQPAPQCRVTIPISTHRTIATIHRNCFPIASIRRGDRIHQNESLADVTYYQSFPTGTYIEGDWNNNRETSNSPNNTFNPQLYTSVRFPVPATAAGWISA